MNTIGKACRSDSHFYRTGGTGQGCVWLSKPRRVLPGRPKRSRWTWWQIQLPALESVVVDVADRELGLHPGRAEGLDLEIGHGAGGDKGTNYTTYRASSRGICINIRISGIVDCRNWLKFRGNLRRRPASRPPLRKSEDFRKKPQLTFRLRPRRPSGEARTWRRRRGGPSRPEVRS